MQDVTTGDTLCDEKQPIILERMEFPDPVIKVRMRCYGFRADSGMTGSVCQGSWSHNAAGLDPCQAQPCGQQDIKGLHQAFIDRPVIQGYGKSSQYFGAVMCNAGGSLVVS